MNDRINITILPMTLGAFSAALDNNVLNICLPLVAREFETDIATAQFISSSYVFTICSLLLFFAYISSAVGRKYIFSLGVGIFGMGSLAAAFATTIGALIFFRVVQGMGAAMFMANGMALVHLHFGNEVKARAFGILASATAGASIIGPVLGGLIASWAGWRAVFFLLVPLALLAGVLALRLLNREDTVPVRNFDRRGTIWSILSVLLFFGALLYLNNGQTPAFAAAIIPALFFLRLFLREERRAENPLLNVTAFARPVFIRANVSAGMMFAIMMAVGIIMPVYVHDTLGYPSLYTGLVLAAMALSIFAVSYIGGVLADRIGAQKIINAGIILVVLGVSLLGLSACLRLDWPLFPANVVLGMGIGFFNPANNKVVMVSVPRNLGTGAAGINVLSRNAGIALGTVISGLGYTFFLNLGAEPALAAFYSLLVFIAASLLMLAANLSSGWNGQTF